MQILAQLGVRIMDPTEGGIMMMDGSESSLVSEVLGEKYQDPIFH